jgi:hypothetical protein
MLESRPAPPSREIIYLSERVASDIAANDRPALDSEIVVTPAMIEAGVLAFYDVDRRIDGIEGAIESAYRAMAARESA